jgi:hypothetical protein
LGHVIAPEMPCARRREPEPRGHMVALELPGAAGASGGLRAAPSREAGVGAVVLT